LGSLQFHIRELKAPQMLSPDPQEDALAADNQAALPPPQVQVGSALAITDYPHHWDEANLNNYLARPVIAAGHDVPSPG